MNFFCRYYRQNVIIIIIPIFCDKKEGKGGGEKRYLGRNKKFSVFYRILLTWQFFLVVIIIRIFYILLYTRAVYTQHVYTYLQFTQCTDLWQHGGYWLNWKRSDDSLYVKLIVNRLVENEFYFVVFISRWTNNLPF